MPKKTKLAKGRLDKFYWLAKEQGFKSRAAFKLIQINKKFNFLQNAKCCIDLCAAPGGWTQVCAKFMPLSSLIVAVDIVKMQPIGGCQTIQGDITLKKTETAVKRVVNDWKADCVLNDGAPNVGGAWSKDAYGQCELSLHALKFATKFLKKDGIFVTKVFRSQDYNSLLWVCQQLFKKVHPFKPASSRMSSAETFLVCEGYLDPKKIDPRLLDAAFVFKDVSNMQVLQSVLSKNYGKKANRSGYAPGQNVLYSEFPVRKWIESEAPVQLLSQHNKLIFDKDDTWLLEKATFEVKEMCEDLKLLGKRDFRNLLKWRLKIKKIQEEETMKDVTEKVEEEEKVDEETKLKEKLEDDLKSLEKKQKRERKKRRRKKLEARRKMAAGTSVADTTDPDVFNVKMIKDQELMDQVLAGEYSEAEESESDDSEFDSDMSQTEILEQDLDRMYDQYKRQKGVLKKMKARDLLLEDMAEDDVEKLDDGEDIKDGLLEVKLKDKSEKANDKADRWFSNSVFDQVEESDSEKEESDADLVVDKKPAKPQITDPLQKTDNFDPNISYKDQLKKSKDTRSRRRRLEQEEKKKLDSSNMFVEVSADEDWSSDDEDAVAEVLAMGKQLLQKKKRERMIDASFNRYSFDDPAGLPAWFVEEEKQHRTPVMPITKEEVKEYKAYLKAINARPIKKVAEAKARKKRRAMKEWEKMKKQASSIADNSELNEKQKSKAIQKLYNKMNQKNRNRKSTMAMITTKSGSRQQRKKVKNEKNARKVRVDGRMKKDARRAKMKKRQGAKRKRSNKSMKGKKSKRRRN